MYTTNSSASRFLGILRHEDFAYPPDNAMGEGIRKSSHVRTMDIAEKSPTPTSALTNDETLRYSRHLILPEVGVEGQLKLKHARVLCIGAGGLGSPVALYLAAAGVGTLGIVDFDIVDAD